MAIGRPKTLSVNLEDLAKMIDHSLLHPTITDDQFVAGLEICKKYNVATGSSHTIMHKPPVLTCFSMCKTIPYSLG